MLKADKIVKMVPALMFLFLALPSGACACIGDSNIHLLVRVLLGFAYFLAFPFVLFVMASSQGLSKKALGIYLLVLVSSVGSWFASEYLILVLPLLPFVAMVVWLRKQSAADT